jgi:hypothetical protein
MRLIGLRVAPEASPGVGSLVGAGQPSSVIGVSRLVVRLTAEFCPAARRFRSRRAAAYFRTSRHRILGYFLLVPERCLSPLTCV